MQAATGLTCENILIWNHEIKQTKNMKTDFQSEGSWISAYLMTKDLWTTDLLVNDLYSKSIDYSSMDNSSIDHRSMDLFHYRPGRPLGPLWTEEAATETPFYSLDTRDS